MNFVTLSSIMEAVPIILIGVASWVLHRFVQKRLGPLPYRPVGVRILIWHLVSVSVFPLAWIGGLAATGSIYRSVDEPSALTTVALALLGFFFLFRLLSMAVRFLLPEARFSSLMVRLALGIGVILLGLRFLGWYDLVMVWMDQPLLKFGPAAISLGLIFKSIFLIWAIFLAATQITSFVQNRVLSRTDVDPSLSFAMMRFLKFFLFGIAVLVILDTAGIELSTLTIFGGALGIGLGFGLQNITNNLVSGMILLLDRSIKQGDVISVGESYGWVVRLGARYIVVRTRDGVEKLIPNANLIASEITNWSHSDRKVRLHIKVGVSYEADPFRVRQTLLAVAETNPRVLKSPPPNVLFVDFAESSMDFELRVWIHDPEAGVESVRSALRFEIWKAFHESGIQIPYPQRDIHIKGNVPALGQQDVAPRGFEESLPPAARPEE